MAGPIKTGKGVRRLHRRIAVTLRNNFLKVAFQILMQPLAAPDQDRTTSGQTGKYLVIKRLLPIFEQYARPISRQDCAHK